MKEVERLLKQIRKRLRDPQATIFYGVEYSSDTKRPDWRARVVPSKNGVTPFLAGASSKQELIKQLNQFIKQKSIKDIAIQYCESQIELGKQSIKFHEDLIKEYEAMDENSHS